jgi:hypothetical protein
MPVAEPRPSSHETAIEIRLAKVQQLFNTFDPSPFHEKELDPAAEEYILDSVDEYALPKPLKLVIHLPVEVGPAASDTIERAIHNHFRYRVEERRRRVRFLLREGRIALAIGLVFLVACMSLREVVGMPSYVVDEGLLILGWVAMWRPLQIFLYDWWPVRHQARIAAKLADMSIELTLTPSSGLLETAHSQ